MTTEQTAQQLELAAQILRTGHPFEVRHDASDRWHASLGVNPAKAVLQDWHIRLVLATPPDNRQLHNPDNLTAEAVGVGYRLALPGEKLDANYDYWLFAGGWKKGHGTGIASELNPGAAMRLPLSVPWPELPDPYAELKAAHAAGKVIESFNRERGIWQDCPSPAFEGGTDYRIKPTESAKPEPAFTLPPPPPGMRWHREEGWKADDLPQGYRPLALREAQQKGDEFRGSGGWREISDVAAGDVTFSGYSHRRTTRPLTFTHAGKTWTWHRPGDPMPCDRDSSVNILCRDEQCFAPSRSLLAKNVNWDECCLDGFDVLGWRYADEKKTVPLGPEDVPPGSVFRPAHWGKKGHEWIELAQVCAKDVKLGTGLSYDFEELEASWLVNRSLSKGQWNPDAWEPCSKEIPA